MSNALLQSQLMATVPTTVVLCCIIIVLCVISIKSIREGLDDLGDKVDLLNSTSRRGFESISAAIEKQTHSLDSFSLKYKEISSEVTEIKKSLSNVLFRGTK